MVVEASCGTPPLPSSRPMYLGIDNTVIHGKVNMEKDQALLLLFYDCNVLPPSCSELATWWH